MSLWEKYQKHDMKHKYGNSRATPHQKKRACESRKPTRRRSKGISPQGMQLPIVTNPYPQLWGIGQGGAGSLQEDAGI